MSDPVLPPEILSDETFEVLGLELPLFAAAVREAKEYDGLGRCDLCYREGEHCFALESAQVIAECAACHEEAPLAVSDRSAGSCGACGEAVAFPLPTTGRVRACASCLMAGLVALPKQTELGRVSWRTALEGLTGEGWVVDPSALLELLRTPGFDTWSAPMTWLFCCNRPMIYQGVRHASDFRERRLGSAQQGFLNTVESATAADWVAMNEGRAVACVFRCTGCGRARGTLDRQESEQET